MEREVVYWRGSAEVRGEVLGALRDKAYLVDELRSLEDVLDRISSNPPQFLIVDATAGEREASERVVDLSTTDKLFGMTIVFLSHQASKRIDVLRKQYSRLIPIDLPFNAEDVVDAIDAVVQADIAEELEAQFQAFEVRRRDMLQENTDPSKLEQTYGGKVLSLARDLQDFDDSALVPVHPEQAKIRDMLTTMTEVNDFLGVHARRCSFITTALGNRLGLDWARMSNVRTVSLLLNRGVLDYHYDLVRVDLLKTLQRKPRVQLERSLYKTAELIRKELKDERAAKTVDVIRALILNEQIEESCEIMQEAQCVLSVELVARACWEIGCWNHYGAYRAVRHFRKGSPYISDRDVLKGIFKIIGEAVCSNTTVCNVFVPNADDPMARAGFGVRGGIAKRNLGDSGSTMAVPVFDLEPGMRLARPLFAYDGMELLESQTCLSDDLIRRLWQLAAVRAIRSQAKVGDKH